MALGFRSMLLVVWFQWDVVAESFLQAAVLPPPAVVLLIAIYGVYSNIWGTQVMCWHTGAQGNLVSPNRGP